MLHFVYRDWTNRHRDCRGGSGGVVEGGSPGGGAAVGGGALWLEVLPSRVEGVRGSLPAGWPVPPSPRSITTCSPRGSLCGSLRSAVAALPLLSSLLPQTCRPLPLLRSRGHSPCFVCPYILLVPDATSGPCHRPGGGGSAARAGGLVDCGPGPPVPGLSRILMEVF